MEKILPTNKKFFTTGFTLLELLVAIVIFVMVSLGSGWILWAFNQSAESAHRLIAAKAVLIKSVEEVRQVARQNYAILPQCRFPGEQDAQKKDCGFHEVLTDYPDLKRTIQVQPQQKHPGIQAVDVALHLQGIDKKKTVYSTLYLKQPVSFALGNLKGRITREAGGLPRGARCVLQQVEGPGKVSVMSKKASASDGANVDFSKNTEIYTLAPGLWHLMVFNGEGKVVFKKTVMIQAGLEQWIEVAI